jgi:hypothetical protein
VAPSKRYPTVDVLRGLALFSMVTSHLTRFQDTTLLGRLMHSPRWIDGAFFFVALSGFVTGLVHRRVVARAGVTASAAKLARRAGFLYVVHVAMVLVAIAVYSADRSSTLPDTPTWVQAGGLFTAVGKVLDLALEPDFNGVLPMYVVFLLWAIVAVFLLRRGPPWLVAAISLSVYVAGQLTNGLPLASCSFQLAGWQLLFTAGLFVGWAWEHERLAIPAARRQKVVVVSIVGAGALFVAARALQGPIARLVGRGIEKPNGGWLAFVFAATVLVAGYTVLERGRRVPWVNAMLRSIEIMGTKGLPGYVTMVLAVMVLDVVPGLPRNDGTAIVIAILCGAAEYAAVLLARQRREPSAVAADWPPPLPALAAAGAGRPPGQTG